MADPRAPQPCSIEPKLGNALRLVGIPLAVAVAGSAATRLFSAKRTLAGHGSAPPPPRPGAGWPPSQVLRW